jgi:hypothetical protein
LWYDKQQSPQEDTQEDDFRYSREESGDTDKSPLIDVTKPNVKRKRAQLEKDSYDEKEPTKQSYR